MPTHGHVAKFYAKPGQRDALVDVLRPMFEQVKAEPGTLLYMMHVSPSEPNAVWFYERYVDAAAFEHHRTTPAHDRALEAIRPFLDPTRTIEVHELELVGCKANAVLPPEVTGLR
jgi:quinol monooxygenase YgiN